MGVSKVDYDNQTLIDLSNDTVTPQTLAKGYTAHNSNGDKIVGIMTSGDAPSSGSGIIDVTELPTSDIDENAVYRLTENVQIEKNEVYIQDDGNPVTLQQYLASLGVPTIPNIYAVDALSNMLETDVQTFSVVNVYILKSDGIAYLNVPALGGTITVGLFGFQAVGYDRGFTENINAEYIDGIYTTVEAFEEFTRYFVREGGEWKEITAYFKGTTPHGLDKSHLISGDLTRKLFSASDILSGECTEVYEEWFLKRDGTFVDKIPTYLFENSNLETATIPHFIKRINSYAFSHCSYLTTVTFKGTPESISDNIFFDTSYLTTINVPWSEGEVAGAPWGANKATINYNYTEG